MTPKRIQSLVFALALGALACSDAHLVTGVYRSQQAVVLEDVAGFEGDGVYVELVFGQYGPDVAGLVRFYGDSNFLFPASGGCDCRFIQEGRYDADDRAVLFTFLGPVSCDDSAPLLGARLEADETGDVLRGRLGLDLEGDSQWTFERVVTEEEMTDSNKTCEEKLVPLVP